jgi:hypothetical protein
VPEKKAEAAVVQVVEDERPTTPETPTSKPKRKSTTIPAESIAPILAQDYQHHEQQQHHSPARQEQDTASIGSGGSSEQQSSSSNYKNRTVRMGKNLKRAWSKRPFAWNSPTAAPVHAGESILFPDSPTIPVSLRGWTLKDAAGVLVDVDDNWIGILFSFVGSKGMTSLFGLGVWNWLMDL